MSYLQHVDQSPRSTASRSRRGSGRATSRQCAGTFSEISAMPSIHVAMPTLFALTAGRPRRSRLGPGVLCRPGVPRSVALGWHYAVDGYVGAAASRSLVLCRPMTARHALTRRQRGGIALSSPAAHGSTDLPRLWPRATMAVGLRFRLARPARPGARRESLSRRGRRGRPRPALLSTAGAGGVRPARSRVGRRRADRVRRDRLCCPGLCRGWPAGWPVREPVQCQRDHRWCGRPVVAAADRGRGGPMAGRPVGLQARHRARALDRLSAP